MTDSRMVAEIDAPGYVDEPSKRYRVGFSFAGEKRDFVRAVAERLALRFKREEILFDEFHRADFARPDLAAYLPKLYRDETDLIVVILCLEYDGREWCGLEWRGVLALLKKRQDTRILLARFDRVVADDLHDLAGYLELDDANPEEVAALVAERWQKNCGSREPERPVELAPSRTRPSTARFAGRFGLTLPLWLALSLVLWLFLEISRAPLQPRGLLGMLVACGLLAAAAELARRAFRILRTRWKRNSRGHLL